MNEHIEQEGEDEDGDEEEEDRDVAEAVSGALHLVASGTQNADDKEENGDRDKAILAV
jgi:hypothetical protein